MMKTTQASFYAFKIQKMFIPTEDQILLIPIRLKNLLQNFHKETQEDHLWRRKT